jgi:hypothetical protein
MLARFPVHPRQILRILVLVVPVLAAFAVVIVGLALLLALIRDDAATDGGNLALASLCAMIGGLFLVVFHFKRETLAIPFRSKPSFLAACRVVLEELGYEVEDHGRERLVSRPSFRAWLFGGRMHVTLDQTEARIDGPKFFVEIVRRRLRLYSHLANVEQSIKDTRQRQGERLLKRVQVSMRLTPAQWAAAGQEVVQQLAGEGTKIFCEVHLMAQSDHGIRESVVDGNVCEWLKQQGILADVHKDHARWEEPLSRAIEEDVGVTHVINQGSGIRSQQSGVRNQESGVTGQSETIHLTPDP